MDELEGRLELSYWAVGAVLGWCGVSARPGKERGVDILLGKGLWPHTLFLLSLGHMEQGEG